MKDVFVYGTLKSDGVLNEGWLGAGCQLVRKHAAVGGYRMISLGDKYPAMFPTESEVINKTYYVLGEIWRIPDDVYAALRHMEEQAGYRTSTVQAKVFADEMAMERHNMNNHIGVEIVQAFTMRQSTDFDSNIPRLALHNVKDLQRNFNLTDEYEESVAVSWNNNPRIHPDGGHVVNPFIYKYFNNRNQP